MDDRDYETFEALCAGFQRRWIALLKDTLKRHGVEETTAKSICGDFSFDLSMLFDQGEFDHARKTYRPFVAFTDDDEDEAKLLVEPNGPQFHEYAFGTTEEVYKGK